MSRADFLARLIPKARRIRWPGVRRNESRKMHALYSLHDNGSQPQGCQPFRARGS